MKIVIVGSGVAGTEAGTYLGSRARQPVEIVEIEVEPTRRCGGWAFQSFPGTESTNLAVRKMYLGRDPEEILRWLNDPRQRESWPAELRERQFSPDRPIPRILIQHYVTWRRTQVRNPLVTYQQVTGEAIHVQLEGTTHVSVTLRSGERIIADRLIMASGSIAVKVPAYLEGVRDHERVIIDPLVRQGDQRRQQIPLGSRVLILGTGLTGEEQAHVLLARGHTKLKLLSRGGRRHFVYPQAQANAALVLDAPPNFLRADTLEEFDERIGEFFHKFTRLGHSHEDILAAIRPHWDVMRHELGGCLHAAETLRLFRRSLAVNSIGTSFEVAATLTEAETSGALEVLRGHIDSVSLREDGAFAVQYTDDASSEFVVDVIINAIGRDIIRHPIWQDMLQDGIALKHAGIGVQVSETGQMLDGCEQASERIWVVGMARAGDHALRHGFLGNSAFNVPQVRAHLYDTIDALLGFPCPRHASKLDEVLFRIAQDGLNARLLRTDETPLIWAVSEDYPEIARALIGSGRVDIDARNNRGNTALIRGACEGRLALTAALIAAGAALDVQNDEGYTAVLLAKRRGNEHIVRALLDAGADPSLQNQWGKSLDNVEYNPRPPAAGPRNARLEAELLRVIRALLPNPKGAKKKRHNGRKGARRRGGHPRPRKGRKSKGGK